MADTSTPVTQTLRPLFPAVFFVNAKRLKDLQSTEAVIRGNVGYPEEPSLRCTFVPRGDMAESARLPSFHKEDRTSKSRPWKSYVHGFFSPGLCDGKPIPVGASL